MKGSFQSQLEQIQAQLDGRYDELKSAVSDKIVLANRRRDDLLEQASHWAKSHDIKHEVRDHSQKLFSLARKRLDLVRKRLARLSDR